MSNPLPYLVRMLLFLAIVACIAYLLHHDLLRVFMNTPILNSVIVGVLVIGIFFVMRQVLSLWPEIRWLRRFQHREPGAPLLETESIDLMAPPRRAPCSTASPAAWTSGASSAAT